MFRDVECQLLADAGHWVQQEQPERVSGDFVLRPLPQKFDQQFRASDRDGATT
jgi:hypothetical protein